MTRAIHQLIATLAPYDAVSNETLAMQAALRAAGYRSEIYAENSAPAVRDSARPLAGFAPSPGDVVLLHYSIWSAAVEAALAAPGPLVTRYHNVTPPDWFVGVNDVVADLCRRARAGLADLAPRTALALADSSYNALDLAAAGFGRCERLPILLPDGPRLERTAAPDPLILTIGRLVPNKRIDEVLRTFACYQRTIAPAATLTIVGSDNGFEAYGAACRRLARALGLTGVDLVGSIDDAEKARLLARATVYLSCSEHEGFCVPIVEAMRAGVPVVARAFGAVAETLGGGGIAVPPDCGPAEIAELLELADRPEIAAAIATGARERITAFAPAATAARLVELVRGVA